MTEEVYHHHRAWLNKLNVDTSQFNYKVKNVRGMFSVLLSVDKRTLNKIEDFQCEKVNVKHIAKCESAI